MEKPVNILIFLGIGSLLAFLPFLILIAFWHPLGTHGIDWASNWGSQFEGVNWLEQQAYWYNTTMGRYSSTALMSTASFWYSLPLARVLVLSVHVGVALSFWWLVKNVFTSISNGVATAITLVVLALFMQQLSNPYDTLYRYSGLLTYQTGLIALLLSIALFFKEKWWLMVLTVFFAVGTNEVTLLQCGLLLGMSLLLFPPVLKERGKIAVLTVAIIGAALALGAPGNFVRATAYENPSVGILDLGALTIATSVYTWVAWVGGTVLVPVLVLLRPYLPNLKFSKKATLGLSFLTIAWLPVSLAPVIFATRGDGLPEGIVDWQILPVAFLLIVLLTTTPKYRLAPLARWSLTAFVIFNFFFQGLGIDRGREQIYPSPLDRINVNALAGNAWLQLLDGTASGYNASAHRQYEQLLKCRNEEACFISPLNHTHANFLYDPSYDRRKKFGGDPLLCYLYGCPGKQVKVAPVGE